MRFTNKREITLNHEWQIICSTESGEIMARLDDSDRLAISAPDDTDENLLVEAANLLPGITIGNAPTIYPGEPVGEDEVGELVAVWEHFQLPEYDFSEATKNPYHAG
jgi:hypothetical protein